MHMCMLNLHVFNMAASHNHICRVQKQLHPGWVASRQNRPELR